MCEQSGLLEKRLRAMRAKRPPSGRACRRRAQRACSPLLTSYIGGIWKGAQPPRTADYLFHLSPVRRRRRCVSARSLSRRMVRAESLGVAGSTVRESVYAME